MQKRRCLISVKEDRAVSPPLCLCRWGNSAVIPPLAFLSLQHMWRSVVVCLFCWNIAWHRAAGAAGAAAAAAAAAALAFTSLNRVSCSLHSWPKLRGRGSYQDCTVMQLATMQYELFFDFVFFFASCGVLSFELSRLHFLHPRQRCISHSCNKSICGSGPRFCACVSITVCVSVREHWLMRNLVCEVSDCSALCSYQ